MSQIKPNSIFISYSHTDSEWLTKLQINLKPLLQQSLGPDSEGEIVAWDDRAIKPGDDWYEKIRQALDSARAAVLLISPDFLGSEFIMKEEWPYLRDVARDVGCKILWVAVRPSVVDETEIGRLQALNNPARPLALLSPAEQEEELVKICRKIKDAIEQPGSRRIRPKPNEPLRTFQPHMSCIDLCVADGEGRLWVSNGLQVRIFQISEAEFLEKWPLPNKRWKHALQQIWQGNLLLSDWDGSLHTFNSHGEAMAFYSAKNSDLPIHRMAVGPEGQLVAAAWNGVIRNWNAKGEPYGESPILLPYLPLCLVPLPDYALAVTDQANYLRLYDASGRPAWLWQADDAIGEVWGSEEQGRCVLVAQIGRTRLVKVIDGEVHETVEFDEPIVHLSRRLDGKGDRWTAIASAGGRIDWLTAHPFTANPDDSVIVDFGIRDIQAVYDPQQPAHLIALGVTSEGKLFSVNEQEVRMHPTPGVVQRLVIDQTGRFLFLLSDDEVLVYSNPAILPVQCKTALEWVDGTLAVNVYNKLTLTLKNTGRVAIHSVQAELYAEGIIDPCADELRTASAIRPGESFELDFRVRAKVAGEVPLNLKVNLADKGGLGVSEIDLHFSVEAVS